MNELSAQTTERSEEHWVGDKGSIEVPEEGLYLAFISLIQVHRINSTTVANSKHQRHLLVSRKATK